MNEIITINTAELKNRKMATQLNTINEAIATGEKSKWTIAEAIKKIIEIQNKNQLFISIPLFLPLEHATKVSRAAIINATPTEYLTLLSIFLTHVL